MTQLTDYSAGRLTGAQLRAAGFVGSCRYVGTPGRAKSATADEVRSHRAAGLHVFGVYENLTTDWALGYSGGQAVARRALADPATQAMDPRAAIFVCADMHLNGSQCNAFRLYVEGARSVLGPRCGAYGFSEAIDAVSSLGVWLWQCGSRRVVRSASCWWQRNDGMRRVAGISCDINEVYRLPYAGGPAPAPPPAPPTPAPPPKPPEYPNARKDDDTMQYILCTGAYQPGVTVGAMRTENGDFIGLSALGTQKMVDADKDPTSPMHIDWVGPDDWKEFDRVSKLRRAALQAQVDFAAAVKAGTTSVKVGG